MFSLIVSIKEIISYSLDCSAYVCVCDLDIAINKYLNMMISLTTTLSFPQRIFALN